MDENARTIRIQKNLITKYETEKHVSQKPTVHHSTVATQTERVRTALILIPFNK